MMEGASYEERQNALLAAVHEGAYRATKDIPKPRESPELFHESRGRDRR